MITDWQAILGRFYLVIGDDYLKRVIFVEPKIENSDEIYEFFKNNNSDSSMVGMHICLVFPFHSDLNSAAIRNMMMEVLGSRKSFQIVIKGTSISLEAKNNFLFLDVEDRDNILFEMSDQLYKQLDGYAYLKGDYNPHITVGKCMDLDEFEKMKNELKKLGKIELNAIVDKVYCKVMGKDENGDVYLKDEVCCELKE